MDYFPLDMTVPGTMILDKPIQNYCVKSVQIRSYFWSVFRCIRTRNNSVFGQFSRSEYTWSRKLSFLFNFTITSPLLSASCGNVFTILAVSIGILQVESFNLGICPFGIRVTFLNKIFLETKVSSSVFRFFETSR